MNEESLTTQQMISTLRYTQHAALNGTQSWPRYVMNDLINAILFVLLCVKYWQRSSQTTLHHNQIPRMCSAWIPMLCFSHGTHQTIAPESVECCFSHSMSGMKCYTFHFHQKPPNTYSHLHIVHTSRKYSLYIFNYLGPSSEIYLSRVDTQLLCCVEISTSASPSNSWPI